MKNCDCPSTTNTDFNWKTFLASVGCTAGGFLIKFVYNKYKVSKLSKQQSNIKITKEQDHEQKNIDTFKTHQKTELVLQLDELNSLNVEKNQAMLYAARNDSNQNHNLTSFIPQKIQEKFSHNKSKSYDSKSDNTLPAFVSPRHKFSTTNSKQTNFQKIKLQQLQLPPPQQNNENDQDNDNNSVLLDKSMHAVQQVNDLMQQISNSGNYVPLVGQHKDAEHHTETIDYQKQ